MSQGRSDPGRSGGFTLIEVLVSIGIIALLIALVVPALGRALGSARGFKCEMSLRATAFDFTIFADESLHGSRGDDDHELSAGQFRIETFQESQYGIDEFWRYGEGSDVTRIPDALGNDPMRCPEVRGELVLRADMPCSGGAVSPKSNVSFAFNFRLNRAEWIDERFNIPRLYPVVLTWRSVSQAGVPLAMDADGRVAEERGVNALYAAPSLGDVTMGADRHWFPSDRHNGATNVAFVDGHVDKSSKPADEPGWNWSYRPDR